MLIFLPVILMLLTAIVLFILHFAKPDFKYPWILAVSGVTLSLVSIFLWQIHFPQTISLPAWQLSASFLYIPSWLADGVSWPYALSLSALAAAVIWTSVVRAENDPIPWAGTLIGMVSNRYIRIDHNSSLDGRGRPNRRGNYRICSPPCWYGIGPLGKFNRHFKGHTPRFPLDTCWHWYSSIDCGWASPWCITSSPPLSKG